MDKKLQATDKKPSDSIKKVQQSRPNESASFSVEAHVKIFDPNSKEVYVEKRA
jgi:hypothetical protein